LATRAADARISALALAVALAAHGVVIGALSTVRKPWGDGRPEPVEFELREPAPPPPEVVRPPELPVAPPDPPRPRLVVRRLAPQPPTAPPPPNQAPPPETPPSAPPVFGVTMSSVVAGDSAVAVPVGNTLLMKPAPARKPGEAPQPYAGTGAQTGAPVSEVNVATLPRVVYEVNSADNYPADAKALGIEGKVKASLTLNEKGQVVGVRILERAGHGFDEAATQALRKFRFSPALTNDGRAVPFRLTFEYRFSIVD